MHIAVALEWTDVGDPSTRSSFGTRCSGSTTPGSGLSGRLVVPPRLLGELGCFGLGRLGAPSSGSATSPSSERRRGRPAGWTWSPGTNLPTTGCQEQCYAGWTLTSPGPGPAEKGSRTPVGKHRTASWRRRFDHISSPSAAMSSLVRHMPNGASPSRPLRLDSDNWWARSPVSNQRCPARTSSTGLAATRMRATWTRDSDVSPTSGPFQSSSGPLGGPVPLAPLLPSAAPATPQSSVTPTAAGRRPETRYPGGTRTSTLPIR